jgi:hypothetical protein
MADDEHDIIQALRTIYEGAFVTTGGSKGGMTAVFHRKFYPDDVEGTVPYVAPLSFGAPDGRYAAFLDTVGLPDCRQAVRDVATELLTNRRDAMVAQAAAQTADSYSRISIGAAFEDAVMNLEWAYWQIKGVKACTDVPKVTASDADLFAWLDMVSPVTEDDDAMVQYMAPYVYQTYAQLGFPDYGAAYLEPLRRYTDSDYASELPTAIEPHFDATAMQEIDDYVEHMGNRLLFIYGQWDPWTAGRFVLGDAADSASLIEAQGTHLSKIMGLDPTDLQTAFAMLTAWTGVTPEPSRIHWAARQRQPTELVVSTRALRARPAQK